MRPRFYLSALVALLGAPSCVQLLTSGPAELGWIGGSAGTTAESAGSTGGSQAASTGAGATGTMGTGGDNGDGGDGGSCGDFGCPPTFLCVDNACQCQAGYLDCQNACINPLSDDTNCGATPGCGATGGSAGSICINATACIDGTCQAYCPSGEIACGSPAMCINPNTNPAWCGASGDCTNLDEGVNCIPGQMCVNGMCM